MMGDSELIDWLLSGDISIQFQTQRDLLGVERPELRERIAKEGWGAAFLEKQHENGHWGRGFYQPKWISTHYTLLDLKNLGISPQIPSIKHILAQIIQTAKSADGGIYPIGATQVSDVCINGMFLNYACYFGVGQDGLNSIVDFLLKEQMDDGGFNCFSNTIEPVHSSMHSTISVLEGIEEYEANNFDYRLAELQETASQAREFLLQHKLFKSDHTGEIIAKGMTMLSYPSRWKYDILRGLDYFRGAQIPYDNRMADAIGLLLGKRRSDGTWPLQAKHPGQVHFDMEKPGKPSRWNTLRAMRVLRHCGIER